jgi:3-isopropylmalate/(R)-2-methylmalate dehydratase small subunit
MASKTAIRTLTGRGLPLPGSDIDTDRIIPARFMKAVTFDGLGEHAFHDVRFDADGKPKDHPFNDARYRGASILLVGSNFGCGSSREHAPQALMRFGIRAILGVSFAEIFAGNCLSIGVPAATLSAVDASVLMESIVGDPALEITLDLVSGAVRAGGREMRIEIPESARSQLVNGTWDGTSVLLGNLSEIAATAARLPYLRGFGG